VNRILIPALFLAVALLSVGAEPRGAVVYREMCAECHGAKGEGVENEYDEPLHGSKSLEKLTSLIERTMPEDDDEACVGEEANAVAAYIYDAFYSPEAQARLNPPRIALARLTNRQYRESIADLVVLRPKPVGSEEGLQAEYFDSDGMDKKSASKLTRVDERIDFDFGAEAPAEGMNAEQFSIAWDGSIRARETGFYEFRVSTPNGARLYVNSVLKPGEGNYRDDGNAESEMPLIDDWVSSGADVREVTGRIFLLGERTYPFRLDYFKYKEAAGSIRLEWKPPHGAWSVPGGADFAPVTTERTMVVKTPFPADDRSMGYERGTSVSREWYRAVTQAALEVATEVDERLDKLSGSWAEAPNRVEKLEKLANSFAEKAFRRPLTAEEKMRYVEAPLAEAETLEQGVVRSVIFVMESPAFLYPELGMETATESYQRAARLALGLWDSVPDDELMRAARGKRLRTREQVAAQAQRMLEDPRARAKVREFFHYWLEMDGERDFGKDEKVFPGFDAAVAADLRRSLNLFVDEVVWSERSDYRDLLLAESIPMNGRLAELYGVDAAGEGFASVKFNPRKRAGVLTHPYLLSAFAYSTESSPIHRGVFLTKHIVGRPLKAPPEAVAFEDADFDPGMTMREKVTELTRSAACMSCHEMINPLGFSLENYDAIGRWRTKANNQKVDPVSEYETEEGETIQLKGARDLAKYAAGSEAAHRAFVRHLYHFFIKQPVAPYGENLLEELREGFADSEFKVKELIAEIVTVVAMHEDQK
jgi:hypothetical protein